LFFKKGEVKNMDNTSLYYQWLHSLERKVISFLEIGLGKRFNYIEKFSHGARLHSKTMMERKKLYHSPKEYWDGAECELVAEVNIKNDSSDQEIAKSITSSFFKSPLHLSALCTFDNYGAGIALEKIGQNARFYFTIRLN